MPDDNAHSTRLLCYKQLLIGRKAGVYEPTPVERGNDARGQERMDSKGEGGDDMVPATMPTSDCL